MKIVQVSAIDATMHGLLRELNTTILNEGNELICVCSDGERVGKLRDEGFDVRTINIDRRISPIGNLKSIYNMYKLFRREKPDIVHVHTPVASVLGRIAAKLAGVQTIIYTAHGFYFHENMSTKQYKLFYTVEKLIAKWCTDYIFTQSEEDGRLATENNFLPPDRITIISNGVDVDNKFNPDNIDTNKISSMKRELGFNENDIIVTFIGRLVKEKGIFDLLEAFNSIEQRNIKLLIIGGTSTSERDQQTHMQLEEYKTNPNITFTGYRGDIPELLTLSDIYCLPSYREGMPRSIIEAMATECAIVATNIRGSREEVDHGVNGYLVNLKKPDDIASSIKIIANDKEILDSFKLNAREKANYLYNEKKVVKKQMNIFESIITAK
ncbi:glycosyltransferase family 4 protein [Virgibacillus sp. CBA3643]|uniref:glycosyltransferase family 4 protein n=1 Tax=Virgibacillus sp. CBA3643 TaxID=2942278 RepID=UPI0035A3139A